MASVRWAHWLGLGRYTLQGRQAPEKGRGTYVLEFEQHEEACVLLAEAGASVAGKNAQGEAVADMLPARGLQRLQKAGELVGREARADRRSNHLVDHRRERAERRAARRGGLAAGRAGLRCFGLQASPAARLPC